MPGRSAGASPSSFIANGPTPPAASSFAPSTPEPPPTSAVAARNEPVAGGDARSGSKASEYQGQVAKGALTVPADAPTACLPDALRTVLADLAGRFGPLAVVSTKHLTTRNHAAGSARHKLHESCKAVNFRVASQRTEAVKAYLRSRPEVGGVEAYRDGVIHIDLNENQAAAQTRTPRSTQRAAD